MKRFACTCMALLLLAAGCQTLDTVTDLGTSIGVATGTITTDQAQSIGRTTKAVAKTFEDITPEQEYYIGRAVAATILDTYKLYRNDAATRYLNTLGQALAMASEKPETFGGYHFAIMDTEEVNAFAAPGGLIMVSRGLLRCCRSEDAVAAVLAHEIGHIEKLHGLKAIKQGRLRSALTIVAVEAGKNLGGEQLAEVTAAFEGSITDITDTLVNGGYARSQEREADQSAVAIMRRVGYNPMGLVDMLQQMDRLMKPDDKGFGKTHPDPADRVADLKALVRGSGPIQRPAAREARFKAAMRGV